MVEPDFGLVDKLNLGTNWDTLTQFSSSVQRIIEKVLRSPFNKNTFRMVYQKKKLENKVEEDKMKQR